MAPELLSGKDFKSSPSLDIWSIGIMTYFMATGKYPWKGRNVKDFYKNIKETPLNFEEQIVSKKLQNLIGRMLEIDPNQRISMIEII
jgi:serine/threonine protein kinase